MDAILVISPGPLTTVQDHGRYGFQHMGVPVSGALDRYAYRIANLLVGNSETAAVLEATFIGPELAVLKEADMAIAGADMQATLNAKPVEPWTSFRVEAGDLLKFGQIKSGCRTYLAVTGGFDVPLVMGSRSTFIGGKMGGFQGRALRKGDLLKIEPGRLLDRSRQLPPADRPDYADEIVLRAIDGPQDTYFAADVQRFYTSPFHLSPKADRTGCRLEGGPIKLQPGFKESIVSEAIMAGSVQVPADGQPIVLFRERTIGGYAKIATVISSDLPKIAQAIPGTQIRFERITLDQAHDIYRSVDERIRSYRFQ
ncbi:MAG: biotin-dependent carboxyltransferase [Desulfobacteraceae bacterium]|nr:MAG: biotin-dependent carboxyltransferase [Desulfobacteraceae bacterium]